jgi:hypothetical protein
MAITNISRDWGVSPSIVRIITTDNLATITTNGYVSAQLNNINTIQHGTFEWTNSDSVLISYNGGEGYFTYDSINKTFVAAGAALPALTSSHIFVGNAGNVATDVAMTGDVTISNTGVTSNNPSLIKYVSIPISSAQWKAMPAPGILLVAAQGPHTIIMVETIDIEMLYNTIAYAAGSPVGAQYGAPVFSDGASTTRGAGDINVAYNVINSIAPLAGQIFAPNAVNVPLYLSCGAAYTTGNSNFVAHVRYYVLNTIV